MFGFGKKKDAKNADEALDSAEKALGLAKHFLGKDTAKEFADGLKYARDVQNGIQQAQLLAQTGLDATAEVVTIQDTGTLINFDPVVILKLKVTPAHEAPFETTGQVTVSKIAIPRAGDTIKIKYSATDHAQFVVLPA